MSDGEARVLVLVSPGCHLCEDACEVVSAVCAELSLDWQQRDLADVDEATRERWREFIPVVLVDGEVHDVLRVSAPRLRCALEPVAGPG